MVLGTSSHAGKTAVAAGLGRLLARRGIRVAPFKAQNMSNNSHVTPEGREIGRAQALQARACRVESHADMNPVLLKPQGSGLCQVVVDGLPWAVRSARAYYEDKPFLAGKAHAAYDRLADRFEAVILEGAGSPAEINLREGDFVNLPMAEYAGALCLLVADIDRGGVFASILGTLDLLEPRHRHLIGGVLINKFRGDATLLESGIREIEVRTGVPVLGVLPWIESLGLEEEDSLGLPEASGPGAVRAALDLAVIRFPTLSNSTDFQSLAATPGVSVRYVDRAVDLGNPDLLVLPGSKSVRRDLEWLWDTGLARAVTAAAQRQIPVMGICGGFQILGRNILDPQGMEGEAGESAGLGLLPVTTTLESEKELGRVEARNLALPFLSKGESLAGYEIHLGRTLPAGTLHPALELTRRNGSSCRRPAGAASEDLPVFGHYLHGLFDPPGIRASLAGWLWKRRGVELPADMMSAADPDPIDRIADALAPLSILEKLLPSLSTRSPAY